MPLTPSIESLTACSVSPLASHRYPSRMPTTLNPWLIPSMVAALMTPLIPGAGPPPTRIASLPLVVPFAISVLSFLFEQKRSDYEDGDRNCQLAKIFVIRDERSFNHSSVSPPPCSAIPQPS